MEFSFREDLYELAEELRDWAKDPIKPFPFHADADKSLNFHYCKTRVSMTFDKVIDRKWYLERRVTIRFRPVTKSERYGLEMEYWKNKSDDRRACLLNELFQKASKDEKENQSDFNKSDRL